MLLPERSECNRAIAVRRSPWFRTILLLGLIWGAALPGRADGAALRFAHGVGGRVGHHTVREGDSLIELARRYGVGYNEIAAANPGVDPFVPAAGTRITIPGRRLLPDAPPGEGLVVNLAEMRLYYLHPLPGSRIETFPVGIGDEGWETPTGSYRIVEKIVAPAWHVPASIRARKPELPETVPPGPDNPLGGYALRLSLGTVLIHGTNRPFGIGRRVSHGCLRLYPEDIEELFRKVRVGTRVTIVRQPVKAAAVNGRVLVEIHRDGVDDPELEALDLLEGKGLLARVDLAKLKAAVSAGSGMPVDVTGE